MTVHIRVERFSDCSKSKNFALCSVSPSRSDFDVSWTLRSSFAVVKGIITHMRRHVVWKSFVRFWPKSPEKLGQYFRFCRWLQCSPRWGWGSKLTRLCSSLNALGTRCFMSREPKLIVSLINSKGWFHTEFGEGDKGFAFDRLLWVSSRVPQLSLKDGNSSSSSK